LAQGRGALRVLAREGAARIAQERLAIRRVGHAVGGEERLRVARRERVALDGAGQAHLLGGGEDGEGARHRERETPAVHARGEFGGEAPRQREAALDPPGRLAQELGDRRDRELVLVGKRRNHARLVHGAGGLAGRVRFEKPRLPGERVRLLDDDRDLAASVPSPQGQSLEAVEDLVGAVAERGDAQRQGRKRAFAVGVFTSQREERRLEARDRDDDHGVASGSGSSWYSGYR